MFRAKIKDDLFLEVPDNLAATYSGFEVMTTALVDESLRFGDVFLDIGANFGYFSVLAASIVGKAGRVYAVEASPEVLPLLSINTRRFGNVSIVPSAVGDRTGVTDFYVTDDFVNSGVARSPFIEKSRKITVPIGRLDDLLSQHEGFAGRVDFIKCDVQGDEFDVLSGMRSIISAQEHLKLVVEWAPAWMKSAGFNPNELPEFLMGLGFRELVVIDDYLKVKMSVAEMEEEFRSDRSGKRFCNLLAIK